MRITIDIDGPVADTLRAIGLALEDPDRLFWLDEHVAALEGQHETDTRLIEGLREQLSRKDSPAPALPIALPPVRIEGLASENVVLGVAETTASSGTPNPVEPGSIPGRPATSCMLFSCAIPASKDKESGGDFCGLHIAVPLSIRLEAKRAFRKGERYVCDNDQCGLTKMSSCGLAIYGACTACGTGVLRRARVPKETAHG